MNRCLTLGFLVLAVVGCAFGQQFSRRPPRQKVPEVDAKCMNCICQASSTCDETIKCHNAGANYFCGPYVISWPYWHDAGRPGDNKGAHDFETCLNNITCAEETVRSYMRKYGRDCDRSGKIDCDDFARIHKLGYGSCDGEDIHDTDYWQRFEACVGYPPGSARNLEFDYVGGGFLQARNLAGGGD